MNLLIGLLLTSCILEEGGVCDGLEGQEATICVQAGTSPSAGATLSSAARSGVSTRSFSESAVSDLHVLVYNSMGELTGHAYSAGSSATVKARSGAGCTVYALVNTGNEDFFSQGPPATEDALKALTTEKLQNMEEVKVNENLLMAGSVDLDIDPGENILSGRLAVSRLASRMILNVSCVGTILTGYRWRNLPAKSWYVARPNLNESDVNDDVAGDDASVASGGWFDEEPVSLSTYSTSLTFYQYENRCGARQSVGGSTGDASDWAVKETFAPVHATYIELYGFNGSSTLTYRLYPGGSASNYNIKRNGSYRYDVTLIASGALVVSGITIEPWTNIDEGSDITVDE